MDPVRYLAVAFQCPHCHQEDAFTRKIAHLDILNERVEVRGICKHCGQSMSSLVIFTKHGPVVQPADTTASNTV